LAKLRVAGEAIGFRLALRSGTEDPAGRSAPPPRRKARFAEGEVGGSVQTSLMKTGFGGAQNSVRALPVLSPFDRLMDRCRYQGYRRVRLHHAILARGSPRSNATRSGRCRWPAWSETRIGFPTTMVIDREGKVVGTVNTLQHGRLEAMLKDQINKQPSW
jgi:hypothetical protein